MELLVADAGRVNSFVGSSARMQNKSQREAIRKLLHYFIAPRVKTELQKNLILTVDLRTGRAV